MLESAAIALAAGVIRPEQVDQARDLNDRLVGTRHPDDSRRALARAFHRSLIVACPNTYMVDLLDLELDQLAEHHADRADGRAADVARAVDDHGRILSLVEGRAPATEIERCVHEHLKTSPLCCGLPI